ncbi:pilus biosynthesis protein PilC [Vulcanimicrobium alpinum]|uniref:Pilus biosynthesis protein PilC n=1 Tax=Vulcanimicrobium alpinum TaxID=3016050 RepID=A0AAN2CAG4_UNVUL|nr:type II secretion system F family protein [Vulcanimicrobium alpinum]BDE06627.1 pilus biosynthesis protein PilC [Vulcanimicrobium alpinum]
MSVPVFRYAARTIEGELVRGTTEAESVDAVLAGLRTRALFVTAVDRETAIARGVGRSLRAGSPRRRALLAFFRSFSTLVRAGIPLRGALKVAIERTSDAALREALRSVLSDVEHGASLSDAMGKRSRAFPKLYVAMIRAGEAGGILDDVLERLATLLERDAELRKKVRAALAYPVVVLLAASGLVLFLIARIVPAFAQMFDSFHVELPASTRLLIAAGEFLQQPAAWAGTLGGAAALALATLAPARTERGAALLDRVRLHIPVAGPLLHKAITARIARMLATLLRSGIELVGAIAVVVPVAGSPTYAAALRRVDVALREGDPLTVPLEASRLFDPLAVALIRVGEETGQLDEMLLKIASYFETDVEAAIATLGAVMEPALICALGVVVGFIVFSVFLPLYALIGNVSK